MNDHILYIGDAEGVSGYAQSLRRVVFCLQTAGIKLSTQYVPHDSNITPDQIALNRIRSTYGKRGNIVIHHQIPHMFQPVPGAYNIGYTMFETTKLPSEWIPHLNRMNEIWVPSQFNKNIFVSSGVTSPVSVVPFPLDTDLYSPKETVKTNFRFLSIFQWTERKNWRDLLKAYFSEFTYSDNVELYLKVYQSSASEYEKNAVQHQIDTIIEEVANKNRPKYVLDFTIKTEPEMIRLFRESSVFVLPSRGESVGLAYIEAMACGLSCIATAWGGQTEFINDSNGYLVHYTMEPVHGMPHIKEYRRDQEWAKINIDDLKQKMRKAFRDKNYKSPAARKVIIDNFSNKTISDLVVSKIKKIPNLHSFRTDYAKIAPIDYKGDAFGLSGYSSAIRLMLKVLRFSNIETKLEPVFHDRKQIEAGPEKNLITDLVNSNVDGQIIINHQTPEFFDLNDKKHKYKIGFTYFETSSIPQKWVAQCNGMDEIWLSSDTNKEVFVHSGVTTKIEIIPPFVDTEHFSPTKKPWNIINRSSFTFLSIFEFTQRKGWDILVEAYAKAFRKSDDVCLIIKTHRNHPPMKEDEFKKSIRDFLNQKNIFEWPRILIYTDPVPYSAMPNLYAASDIFILPTRGEALCYPAMEAMATGKPCIITGSGGHTSFINSENGYLIDYKLLPVSNFTHSPWYTRDQKIAEADLNSLIVIMRHVFANKTEVTKKGQTSRRLIEVHHSITKGSEHVVRRLKEISKDL